MAPPKGPDLARSGSTWIHWWSSVASANRLTRAWSISCQSEYPRWVPDSPWKSSMACTTVVMAGQATWPRRRLPAGLLEPDALVLAALGMQEQSQQDHGEQQVEDHDADAAEDGAEEYQHVHHSQHDGEHVTPAPLVGHGEAAHAEAQRHQVDDLSEDHAQYAEEGGDVTEHHGALQRLGL